MKKKQTLPSLKEQAFLSWAPICSQDWGTWPHFQISYCVKNQSRVISETLGACPPSPGITAYIFYYMST